MSESPLVVASLAAKRVGIVTPSANPTVEPELRALMPAEVAMYAARLPVYPGDLRDRTARYVDAYAPALAGFGTLRLDAAYIGMTGASYALRYSGDRSLTERLATGAGMPVWTASLAIVEALHTLDISTIVLVSPYPQWLTERALAYWTSAGITVDQVVDFGETFRAYQLTDEEVAERLAQVKPARGGAVVMSGTGMMSLRVIAALRASIDVPILSSNLCGGWRLLKAIDEAASATLRTVCPQLAATLDR